MTEESKFKYVIHGRPDFSFLSVRIPENETLKVEASAMATMDLGLRMKTKFSGGVGRLLTGESLFINEFTAVDEPGDIGIAPGAPGDIDHVYLNGETIFLQNSAYLASDPEVELATKWQGMMKGFFAGEKFFLIRCSGRGDLWFNTYGAMIKIDVDREYVVDTGHVVAFTEGLDYKVSRIGDYKSLFLSGEGLVCRFRGEGTVWIQTRNMAALLGWVNPFRKSGNSGGD